MVDEDKSQEMQHLMPARQEVWSMFDRIAPRYDMLNRMLSFRRDVAWRNKMASRLRGTQNLAVLDLATGTADQLLALFKKKVPIHSAIGLDMSENMLELGRIKIAKHGLEQVVSLASGDAMNLRLEDDRFDAVTISFGIRNVGDVGKAFREMRRVLKPGGTVLILEFSLPANRIIRSLYLFYFRHILPRVGAMVSGDAHAYRYLNETAETFPYGQVFCDTMLSAGMVNVTATPLTFGIATLYQGYKPVPAAS